MFLQEPLIYAEFNMKCQDESEERELYFKGEFQFKFEWEKL